MDPIIRPWKNFVHDGHTYRITVYGGLRGVREQAPYFSLTGVVQRWAPGGYWDEYSSGCIHDEILQHWPELEPLSALHLSEENGVPMHAQSNAWFWFRGSLKNEMSVGPHAPSQDPHCCLEHFARHVRISFTEAQEVRKSIRDAAKQMTTFYQRVWENKDLQVMEVLLTSWVEGQKPRWKAEAEAAIKGFNLVIF